MIYKTLLNLFLLALSGAAASAGTIADFNFDSDLPGTATTFMDTNNGISATFSSSADPGGFVIYPSMFETLTGNVLGDPGPAFANNLDLNINFSQSLTAITLDFATDDFVTPSPFTITAYENSVLVGSNTSTGMFLSGFTFPEGEISFSGGAFNQVILSSPALDFAVDNIQVAAAPEPGTFAMIGTALLLLPVVLRRHR